MNRGKTDVTIMNRGERAEEATCSSAAEVHAASMLMSAPAMKLPVGGGGGGGGHC
jgi:hypothetical protein